MLVLPFRPPIRQSRKACSTPIYNFRTFTSRTANGTSTTHCAPLARSQTSSTPTRSLFLISPRKSASPAYLSLCELTDAIVAEWRAAGRKGVSPPLAFAEACKRRPDLRDTAVRPGGQWVNPAAHADQP